MLSRDPFEGLIDDFDGGALAPVAKQVGEIVDRVTEQALASIEGGGAPTTYRDPCKKCRGGNFVSYSGRIVGKCFVCKGVGYFERKTSPEVREQARQATAARKARIETDSIKTFSDAYPAIWQWITESAPRFEFAHSMHLAILKYGHLTENQMAACERSIAKRDEARQEAKARVENAPAIETDKLMAAFDKASASGLKNPRLRFELFTATPAKATSKNPGAVYLKAGETYLGKITGGRYVASREATPEQRQAIVDTMADPVAASVAYGRRTGNCACCGRELTDPESVERGIGPICFNKYF